MSVGRFALLTLAFAAAGCGGSFSDARDDEIPPARFSTIDEERGSYGGVAIGESKEKLFEAFGRRRPVGENEPALPKNAPEDGVLGPNPIPSNDVYCYDDVCFWLNDRYRSGRSTPYVDRGEIEGFYVTSPGAETLRGIEVRDAADDVRDAYPGLRCGEIEREFVGADRFCTGRIARDRYIWFGGDPVDNITVAAISFDE